jgi:hypothetical protein
MSLRSYSGILQGIRPLRIGWPTWDLRSSLAMQVGCLSALKNFGLVQEAYGRLKLTQRGVTSSRGKEAHQIDVCFLEELGESEGGTRVALLAL